MPLQSNEDLERPTTDEFQKKDTKQSKFIEQHCIKKANAQRSEMQPVW